MKVEGEYVFNGPRDEVWELVRDPEALSSALPGAQSFEQVSESEYEGVMDVRVGPVAGVFSGRITISDEVPPEKCTMAVEGKGKPGFLKGTGHMNLTENNDGTTLMSYSGDVQIGGRLAGVGQRMLDTASKSMIRQGLESLNKMLEARIAAKSEGQEVEYIPPSEAEFATTVAKDMATEMFFSSRVILFIIGALAIIAIILALILSS